MDVNILKQEFGGAKTYENKHPKAGIYLAALKPMSISFHDGSCGDGEVHCGCR